MAVKNEKQKSAPEGAEIHAEQEARQPWEGFTHFAYIGPSLPGGALKQNAVMTGTFAEIKAFLAAPLEQYPQAERLIVPLEKLGDQLKRVKAPGNITHKYYNDIVSQMSAKREE